MTTKDQILEEIRKLNDEMGRAPGQKLFAKKTGISRTHWEGGYWPRWSAAIEEAGIKANNPPQTTSVDELNRSYLQLVEELGKIPTLAEIRFKKRSTPDFPSVDTFQKHIGTAQQVANSALKFALSIKYEGNALAILEDELSEIEIGDDLPTQKEGFVYLLKSGKFYKIGQSADLEKRIKQISIALPNKVELIHSIRTDDPPGIEAYWHRRFAEKRKNGEWFELSREDVRAFRRRKFQ